MKKIPEAEQEITNYLVKAYNAFIELEPTHPMHLDEFVEGIHRCEFIIMHRIVQRDYPKEFPTFKGNEKK